MTRSSDRISWSRPIVRALFNDRQLNADIRLGMDGPSGFPTHGFHRDIANQQAILAGNNNLGGMLARSQRIDGGKGEP